jgi:hypothetical protein
LCALSLSLLLPVSYAQSTDANPSLLSIQAAISQGDLDAANALLETALRSHPDDGGLPAQ